MKIPRHLQIHPQQLDYIRITEIEHQADRRHRLPQGQHSVGQGHRRGFDLNHAVLDAWVSRVEGAVA